MDLIKKIDKITAKIQEQILIITGVVVCLLIFISAITRYIFKSDFYGSEEITLFFAFWLYFIGTMYAARKVTHINANMVTMLVNNPKIVKTVDLIKNIISLIVCIGVTYFCFKYVGWSVQMNARSNVFKLPNVIGQLPILLGFFMWCLYLIRDLVFSFRSLK